MSDVELDGHRTRIDRLAATPDRITELAEGISIRDLGWRPAADAFSFVEQACHLRDLEIEGYGVRIRRLLEEDSPHLAGFDGSKVAAERDYQAQSFDEALAAFRAARLANVAAVASLDGASLSRGGVFEESGDVTLGRVLEMMLEHDEDHLRQLGAIRDALARGASADA